MSTGKRLGGEEKTIRGRFLDHLNFGYAKHINVFKQPSEDVVEQMLRLNISKDVINRYCNGIEFDCMSCMVHAICMKNLNGGLEIYSDIYCQSPVTYGKKGLIYIKRKPLEEEKKNDKGSHLLLFADYIDFLAYESLHGLIFKDIPKWSDVLILNQVTNLNAWFDAISKSNYDHLCLLLPLSTAGRTLSKTVEELYKSSARNYSKIYSCFPRLADFARYKDTMLNASKIIL